MRRLRTTGPIRELVFDLTSAVLRIPQAPSVYADPAADPTDRGSIAMAVLLVARREQDDMDALIDEASGVARHAGRTWAEIGTALGISRQAAQKRFQGVR